MKDRILFRLQGTVAHGKGKGRQVGMPTANLEVPAGTALPPAGVYATICRFDGSLRMGVTNVGPRPTVDQDTRYTVETYLPGYSGDLYGKMMEVEFYRCLRPISRFPSLQAVKEQVDRDVAACEAYFAEYGYGEA